MVSHIRKNYILSEVETIMLIEAFSCILKGKRNYLGQTV